MTERSIEDLRRLLDEARARRWEALGGPRREWRLAAGAVLTAERQLAEAEGVEYADHVDSDLDCDPGAPLPHVVSSGQGVCLAYYLRQPPPPGWRGQTVQVVTSASAGAIAMLAFRGSTHSVSGPNDEALGGHPLWGRGLRRYQLHQVRRSRWIAELERQNSVHPFHRGGWAERTNHYLFTFHDELFECVAPSYVAEVRYDTMAQVVRDMVERLLV